MSLVNEMLNDLQQDQKPQAMLKGMVAVESISFLARNTKKLIIIVFFLFIILAAFIFAPQTVLEKSNHSPATLVKDITPKSEPPVESEPTMQVSKVAAKPEEVPELLKVNPLSATKLESNPLPVSIKSLEQSQLVVATKQPLDEVNNTKKDTAKKPALSVASNKRSQSKIESNKPMIKISRTTQAEKDLRQITEVWPNNDYVTNKQSVDRLLTEYQDLDIAWLNTINFLQSSNPVLYQHYLTQALEKFPQQKAFRMILVKRLLGEKAYALALAELRKLDPINWDANQYRIGGFLAQKTIDHRSAIVYYNQLLLSNPNQGDINMAMAISLEAVSEKNLAIIKFQRALEDADLSTLQRQFIAQRIAVLQG